MKSPRPPFRPPPSVSWNGPVIDPPKETIEGVECFQCKKRIKGNEDYFGIYRNSFKGATLHFHIDCFIGVAGEEYANHLEYAATECKKCGASGASSNRLLCVGCNSKIAPCNKCGAPMRPRVNKQNNSVFIGCSSYPLCKNTRRL